MHTEHFPKCTTLFGTVTDAEKVDLQNVCEVDWVIFSINQVCWESRSCRTLHRAVKLSRFGSLRQQFEGCYTLSVCFGVRTMIFCILCRLGNMEQGSERGVRQQLFFRRRGMDVVWAAVGI